MYGLQAEAHFDSAHFLTNYHGKCENLHGHRWRIVATITTENLADGLADNGTSRDMVLDFGAFKRLVAEIADELDISIRTVERHIYLALIDLKKVLLTLFFFYLG